MYMNSKERFIIRYISPSNGFCLDGFYLPSTVSRKTQKMVHDFPFVGIALQDHVNNEPPVHKRSLLDKVPYSEGPMLIWLIWGTPKEDYARELTEVFFRFYMNTSDSKAY